MTRDFSLSGTFQQKPFPILLVDLKAAGNTGILLVRKDAIEKKIFFLNGEPVACRSNRKKELLGEILRARGKISRAQLDEAILETKKDTKHNFGEILLQKKFVTPDELYANTKYQFVSILFSLFAWEDGSYSFQEREASGLIPPGLPHFYVKFSKLISEGVRVIRDEGFVDRILGGNEQFVKKTDVAIPSGDLSFGGADQVILNALQDRMMVKDVAAAAGLEPGKVKRVLFTLSCLGSVELGAPGSLLDPDAVAAALTGGEERGSVADDGSPPSPVVTEEAGEVQANQSARAWPLSEPEPAEEERGAEIEEAAVLDPVEKPLEAVEPQAPVVDQIEAAVEKARTSMAGPAEGETPLEDALAAAAAEEKGDAGETTLPAEEVPADPVTLEPEGEGLPEEEEALSPFARAMAGAGAGAVLQGSPDKGDSEEPEVLPESAASGTGSPEKAGEREPEPVEAEAAKRPETSKIKKKSSLAVPVLTGLGALLIGLGLIYFLKGKTPEPPAPPAATVQPPAAEKSPGDIIRELAEEGGGEKLAKVTVPDRAAGQPGGEEKAPAKEPAVAIGEEAASPTEKAVSADVPAQDGTKGEKRVAATDDLAVKAPVPRPEPVSPKAGEMTGAKAVPESAEELPPDTEAEKIIAAVPGGEDGGAAKPKGEAKPTAVAPAAKEDRTVAKTEVPAKPVPPKAPVKTVKQTPTVQGVWEEHYARGLELFSDGSLEPAFKTWADAVRSAPDQAYAIQIELTSYLSYAARDIKEAAPDEKVFIVKATLKDKEYYKVLCGFYPDKAAAEQALRVLTPYLKAQKPYLVRAIRLKPDLQD